MLQFRYVTLLPALLVWGIIGYGPLKGYASQDPGLEEEVSRIIKGFKPQKGAGNWIFEQPETKGKGKSPVEYRYDDRLGMAVHYEDSPSEESDVEEPRAPFQRGESFDLYKLEVPSKKQKSPLSSGTSLSGLKTIDEDRQVAIYSLNNSPAPKTAIEKKRHAQEEEDEKEDSVEAQEPPVKKARVLEKEKKQKKSSLKKKTWHP